MSTMLGILTAEVLRVVTSPYAVSLKSLHDVVKETNDATIQSWADGHACQIKALASAILEGLQLWPYVLTIVQRLSRVVSIRNAILLQQPTFLDMLLRAAAASQSGYHKYSPTCIAMLSTPLHQGSSSPASLPGFFLKVLEEAAESPSASTIRPIYLMLTGGCTELLDILSTGVVTRFQEQLIRTLKSLENQSVNLLCLATFAAIVRQRKRFVQSESTQSISSDPPDISNTAAPAGTNVDFDPIQQFFTHKKAFKTMHLVLLQVIFACSGSSEIFLAEAIENVKLAKQITDAIDPKLQDEWLKRNTTLMRKLYEKVLRPGLSPKMRITTIDLIFSLSSGTQLSLDILGVIQTHIRESDRIGHAGSSTLRLPGTLLGRACPKFDNDDVGTLLHTTLVAAVQPMQPNNDSLETTLNCISLVRDLESILHDVPTLRHGILYALSTNKFSEPMTRFTSFSLVKSHMVCSECEVCPAQYEYFRRNLCFAIIALLLKATLYSLADEPGIGTALAVSLVVRQQQFTVDSPECSFMKDRYPYRKDFGTVSISEIECTPTIQRASENWRERLSVDLLRGAAYHHDSIVQTIGQVCRDLEERCEDVERPLREERAKRDDLESKLDDALRRVAESDREGVEKSLSLDELDAQRTRLYSQNEALEVKATMLLERVAKLEALLHERDNDARNEAKKQHLEYDAAMTVRDEIIEERDEQIHGFVRALASLREELETTSQDKLAASSRNVVLEAEVKDYQSQLKLEREDSASKDDEINRYQGIEESQKVEINVLGQKLRDSIAEMQVTTARYIDAEKTLHIDMEKLRRDQQAVILDFAGHADRIKDYHTKEVHTLQARIQATDRTAITERQRKDAKITQLEKEIEILVGEREVKAKEFTEVQDLSRRLVAVIGVTSGSNGPNQIAFGNDHRSEEVTLHPQVRVTNQRLQVEDQYQSEQSEDLERDDYTSKSFGSSTSSKSGPTPKRSKMRRIPRTPHVHQDQLRVPLKSDKATEASEARAKRKPLQDLAQHKQNQRSGSNDHQRCQLKPKHNQTRGGEGYTVETGLMDVNDLTFNESDIFASTQGVMNSELDRTKPAHTYEDTIADL
ncbi:MAG: hypothetical protein M1827_007390 [Pycnora praestabilis]|nr:MAG: hypothetical protein M1827_007390 [Pycnora praestabilis]